MNNKEAIDKIQEARNDIRDLHQEFPHYKLLSISTKLGRAKDLLLKEDELVKCVNCGALIKFEQRCMVCLKW